LARGIATAERTLLRFVPLQLRQQALDDVLAVAGADLADIDEMPAAMHADEQRAEAAIGLAPAADHHLVPGAAFGLGPVAAAARFVRRGEILGDDAFQVHAAGRLQHRIARGLEMLDEADQRLLLVEERRGPL